MIVIDTLDQLARHALPGLHARLSAILAELGAAYGDQAVGSLSFSEYLGGPVHLVERMTDLSEIQPLEWRDGRRISLLDAPSPWFDTAEWIESGSFALFLAIDNSAGGTQFVVPRAIADTMPNVGASIELRERAST